MMRRGKVTLTAFSGILLISLACLATAGLHAQEVHVNAGFLTDSVKIGERTAFFVSARYPREATVLFPDSTSTFYPFEYLTRTWFPTVTENDISRDSVVYYLTTFEVERTQYLYLPVYHVQPRDCTEFFSPVDSVLITQMVAQVPDSVGVKDLPLLADTVYEPVPREFNYLFLIIGILALVVVAVVIWIIFGARITRYFRTRALMRNHAAFVARYEQLVSQLQGSYSATQTEKALAMWKQYMEQLEARPYSKLTTRETLSLIRNESLGQHLRMVDRAIYGHDTAVVEPLENLKSFAAQRFTKKLQELKHGN